MTRWSLNARAIPRVICITAVFTVMADTFGQDLTITPNIRPRHLLADRFVFSARAALQGGFPLRDEQLQLARILLELSLELNKDDAQLWRLQIDLAKQMGDRQAHLEALRRYCRLAPKDDVAQLEFVLARVEPLQLLEQRVAIIQNVFDRARPENLTEAIRSRLASYVAAGAYELGDQKRFKQYLKKALKLDPANYQAAQMAFDLVHDRKELSVLESGSAMMLVIRATPLDMAPRLEFARLLLSQGYYLPATEQFAVVNRVNNLVQDYQSMFEWVLCAAATGHYDEGIAMIDAVEAGLNPPPLAEDESDQLLDPNLIEQTDQEQPESEAYKSDGPEIWSSSQPRQPIPLDLELLRLTIYHHVDHEARAEGAYGRLRLRLHRRLEAGDAQVRLDMVWLAVLYDRFGPQDRQMFERLATDEATDTMWLRRVRGWLALNSGQLEKARDLLAPNADKDMFAAYGMAMSFTDQDKDKKIKYLEMAISNAYDTLGGLLAAMELHELQVELQPTEIGTRLLKMYKQWPVSLRDPDPKRKPLVRLDINANQQRFDFLDPIIATVRLHNATEVRLSLGPDATVPTQVLLLISPQFKSVVSDLPPVVVDLHRRLTLEPGKSIQVDVRLDRSHLGMLMANRPIERIGFNITAMLDPQPVQGERLGVGLLGATDYARFLERRASPMTMANVERWIEQLDEPDPVERMKSFATLLRIASSPDDGEDEIWQKLQTTISKKINRTFANLKVYEQAWALFFMESSKEAYEAFAQIIEVARRSDEPMVRISYLTTKVFDPKSPDIDAAIRHSNPQISQYAKELRVSREFLMQSMERYKKKSEKAGELQDQ